MNIEELNRILEKRILILDGSMGTLIQQQLPDYKGLPDLLNLENPDLIASIHKSYIDSGADVILTNTYGASSIKLGEVGSGDNANKINSMASMVCASGSRVTRLT